MKVQTAKIGLALSLLFLLEVGSGFAQGGYGVTAEVPFAFTVGNTHFDSGRFLINEANSSLDVLNITGQEGGRGIYLMAGGTLLDYRSNTHPKLVFKKYGDHYFLSQIWFGSGGMGCQLRPSKSEEEAAQTAANMNTKASVVEVAAR